MSSSIEAVSYDEIICSMDLLDRYRNDALLCLDEGRFTMAEDLFSTIKSYVDELDQPSLVSAAKEDLAIVKTLLAKFEESELLLKDVYRERVNRYGSQHPGLFSVLQNMTALYCEWGNFEAAKPLSLESVDVASGAFGMDDPRTLFSLATLCTILLALQDYPACNRVLGQVLDGCQRSLSLYDPLVLRALESKAILLNRCGLQQESMSLFETVYALRQTLFAPDHPAVLQAAHNLGVAHWQLGNSIQSINAFKHASQRTEVLGPNHPQTLSTMKEMQVVLDWISD